MASEINQEKTGLKYRMEDYERVWTIPDWVRVQQNEDLLTTQTFHFETLESGRVKTKWVVGLRRSPRNQISAYWKLLDVTGFHSNKIETTVSMSLLSTDSSVNSDKTQTKSFELNETHEFSNWLIFNGNAASWQKWVYFCGSIKFKLKLTLREPDVPGAETIRQQFHKSSVEKICANLATLLNDDSTADLKILTSDGMELFAHKAILKAQCPVFDSMFRSKMSESQTGIVDINDVTGKTMGIFLRYFYSGDLLPTWKEEDTVVEFTYTAGKYQLTDILKLLDQILGTRDEEEATQTDVLLIDLAAKLGIKNAEKELLCRIVKKTNRVKSRDELFGLYGIGN